MIERAMVMAEEDVLVPENFPLKMRPEKESPSPKMEELFDGFSLKTGKEILENHLIRRAMAATGGNRTRASQLLEISHPSLLSKLKTYNIP
jgi:two-component system response regulator AtoC